MNRKVSKSAISGSVTCPSSKSGMQRAVAAALLSEGTTRIFNPSDCDDSLSSLDMIERLGADVKTQDGVILIEGGFHVKNAEIDCGESGTSARMFTPIVSLSGKEVTLTGHGSLLTRPVSLIEDSLRELGMGISSNESKLPVNVLSRIKGGETTVDASLSSQFLTGLLMALPCAEKDSLLHVKNLKSRQYIDITLSILKSFGIEVANSNYEEFTIKGNQKFKACDIEIEGDWSGAAFLLCAGAVAGKITVNKLQSDSVQPDRAFMDALKLAGASVKIEENSVTVEKGSLTGFDFDATDCPDLFPPLAALALFCRGETRIKGTHRLTHKESNRALTIKEEFEKLGGDVTLHKDTMIIKGSNLKGNIIDPHSDHRIAMACAVAALGAEGTVEITNPECVNKSYSSFFEDMKSLGADII